MDTFFYLIWLLKSHRWLALTIIRWQANYFHWFYQTSNKFREDTANVFEQLILLVKCNICDWTLGWEMDHTEVCMKNTASQFHLFILICISSYCVHLNSYFGFRLSILLYQDYYLYLYQLIWFILYFFFVEQNL